MAGRRGTGAGGAIGVTTATDGTFDGVGSVPIYWQRHDAIGGPPRGVLLLSHGYAEHVGRYREIGRASCRERV